MNASFESVLFDFDGTLADSLPLCIKAFREAVEPLAKRKLADAEIIATFGPSEEGTMASLLAGEATRAEGVRRYLERYEALHEAMCPAPFPGIRKLLKSLGDAGIFLGIVTGKGPRSAAISLQKLDLAGAFATVKCGDASGPTKTRRLLEIFAENPALRPERSLYVGDAPSDVHACRAAGVPIAAALWAPTTDPAALLALRPDFHFSTPDALREFLCKG
ncbi:MAG: HAD family hydrolase [Puniceicoccales bacterium]|jgi:phosphoglycolate phosphatase/pyrophosphatase PpaX|nr:HAD family hydrolase [Puniceicoccales bacterium]